MKRFVLDTSGLLTLRDDEPGAERVAEVLGLALEGKAKCFACFISLMEILHRVWRDEGQAAGQLAYQQCLALPMEWISNSEPLLLKAADYKAHFPLSMTDAWIAACASENGAALLHKDPEFALLPVAQELLPLKDKQAQ